MEEIVKGGNKRVVGADMQSQHIPQVFDGVHVGLGGWSIHPRHLLPLLEPVHHHSSVTEGIVVLELGAGSNRLHGRQHKGAENGALVLHAGQTVFHTV